MIYGEAGDDSIWGGWDDGDDTIDGGDGDDYVEVKMDTTKSTVERATTSLYGDLGDHGSTAMT